jgi:signal transduction histidine kinase
VTATADRVVLPALAVGAGALALLAGWPLTWWQALALVVATVALLVLCTLDVALTPLTLLVCGAVVVSQVGRDLEPALFLVSLLALVVTGAGPFTWRIGLMVVAMLATPVMAGLVGDEVSLGVWLLGIGFPAAMGWVVGRQDRLTRELADARLALAEQRVTEERRRIARDVHDLVGHGLAAALVQITSARHVLRHDPDSAEEALEVAERVARSGMRELRTTVAALRDVTEPSTSLPGLADLDDLVRAGRAAGRHVGLVRRGDPADVDAVVGLTLYRVCQESLANAARHAPGTPVSIELDTEGPEVVLDVRNGLPEAPAATEVERPRFGIQGMRERVEVVGGHLEAGPDGRDWWVHCVIPGSEVA